MLNICLRKFWFYRLGRQLWVGHLELCEVVSLFTPLEAVGFWMLNFYRTVAFVRKEPKESLCVSPSSELPERSDRSS